MFSGNKTPQGISHNHLVKRSKQVQKSNLPFYVSPFIHQEVLINFNDCQINLYNEFIEFLH